MEWKLQEIAEELKHGRDVTTIISSTYSFVWIDNGQQFPTCLLWISLYYARLGTPYLPNFFRIYHHNNPLLPSSIPSPPTTMFNDSYWLTPWCYYDPEKRTLDIDMKHIDIAYGSFIYPSIIQAEMYFNPELFVSKDSTTSTSPAIFTLGKGSFAKVTAVKRLDVRFARKQYLKETDVYYYQDEVAVLIMIQKAGGNNNINKMYDHDASSLSIYLELCKCDLLNFFVKESSLQNPYSAYYKQTCIKVYNSMVQALKFLHEKVNFMHLDIKINNILVDDDGCFKLADFGCACSLHTPVPFLPCNPRYRPPEIHDHVSPATDIWCLGIVMLLLYTQDWNATLSNDTLFKQLAQNNNNAIIIHLQEELLNIDYNLRQLKFI